MYRATHPNLVVVQGGAVVLVLQGWTTEGAGGVQLTLLRSVTTEPVLHSLPRGLPVVLPRGGPVPSLPALLARTVRDVRDVLLELDGALFGEPAVACFLTHQPALLVQREKLVALAAQPMRRVRHNPAALQAWRHLTHICSRLDVVCPCQAHGRRNRGIIIHDEDIHKHAKLNGSEANVHRSLSLHTLGVARQVLVASMIFAAVVCALDIFGHNASVVIDSLPFRPPHVAGEASDHVLADHHWNPPSVWQVRPQCHAAVVRVERVAR